MVCLAISGSILAGVHYYPTDLPQQTAVVAPADSPSDNCRECYDWCAREHPNSGGCKYNCQVYVCRKGGQTRMTRKKVSLFSHIVRQG
jgi:hypothetical protein